MPALDEFGATTAGELRLPALFVQCATSLIASHSLCDRWFCFIDSFFDAFLSELHSDVLQEKDKIVKKMDELIPLSPEELVKPEKQQQIQTLKNQLEDLKSKSPSLFSTAENVMIQLLGNLPKLKI